MRKIFFKISFFLLFLSFFLILFTLKSERIKTFGGSSENIRGWLWSENAGWISVNCYNDYNHDGKFENCCPSGSDCPHESAGSNYGLNLNSDYSLSGYAWSENAGWLCFGSTCNETSPDNNSSWACLGKRNSYGNCKPDCGECFDIPSSDVCTASFDNSDCPSIATGSDNTLKAHWPLNSISGENNDKVLDISGYNNHGTIKPSPNNGPVLVSARFKNGLKFDGQDDYVSCGNSTNLQINIGSVEAFIKTSNAGSGLRAIVVKPSAFGMFLKDNEFGIYDYSTDSWRGTGVYLNDNKWHHVAFTFQSGLINGTILYIDGEKKLITSMGVLNQTNEVSIGGTNTSYYFNGLIDNVAIYSRVKSAEEIWDDSHNEISGWAKILNLEDKGWMKLKGLTADGNYFGAYLENYSQGGGFYTISGFLWQTEGNEEMNPNGLIGHYKNNGNWNDSSSKNRHAIAFNGASFVSDGRFEKAGSFDGVDDYTRASGFIELGTSNQPYTIEGWVRIAENETDGNIIFMSSSADGSGWCLPPVKLSNQKLCATSWNGNEVTVCGTTTIEPKKWYHFATTWDSTNGLRIYVNGNLENSIPMSNYQASQTSNYIFQAFSKPGCAGDKGFLKGDIDNVAIYSYSKTATEILNDYYKQWGYLNGLTSNKAIPYGWFKGDISTATVSPVAFNEFRVLNYGCQGDIPNLYLKWSPSLWAESYSYFRLTSDTPNSCPDCSNPNYTEYPVLAGACSNVECSFRDSNGTINQNTGYCYCLKAFNKYGSIWATSNPPTYPHPYWKKTPFCPPTNIGVDGSVCGYNKIVWQLNESMTTNADGFSIYRSLKYDGCGTGASVQELINSVVNGTCEIIAHAGEALTTFNVYNGSDALVAFYKMNEESWNGSPNEVWDSSGKMNHGTARNGLSTTLGKFKRAGNFIEANNHYIEVPHNSNLNFSSSQTIEAFIKTTDSNGVIISKVDSSSPYNGYVLSVGRFSPVGQDTGKICYWPGNSPDYGWVCSNSTVNDNNWHHIALVRNGSVVYFYKDGKLDGIANVGATMTSSNSNLFIGFSNMISNSYLNGLIDNLSIYNYAKPYKEILIDAEAFPLETTPSGKNNTCNLGNGFEIPIYCPNQKNPTNCGNDPNTGCTGSNNFCLVCTDTKKCCRFYDKRIVSNIPYFYRVTVFSAYGGESSASSLPSSHQIYNCAKTNEDPSAYRRGCDRSICYPPLKYKEK
jgi:hypothetical protein